MTPPNDPKPLNQHDLKAIERRLDDVPPAYRTIIKHLIATVRLYQDWYADATNSRLRPVLAQIELLRINRDAELSEDTIRQLMKGVPYNDDKE